jgi:superfamily II RNA helicase
MPAKAVIFSSTSKFDGQHLRILNKSEFIQMSGRAGRRGIDDKGMVVTIIDKFVNKKEIQKIIQGKTEPVISMFHINLNTVLKNIRNKKIYDVSLISNSFFKYQNYLFKTKIKKTLIQIKTRTLQLISPFDDSLDYLIKIWNLYEKIRFYLKKTIFLNDIAKKIFKNKINLTDQTNKSQFYITILQKIGNLAIVIFSFLENVKWIKKNKLILKNNTVKNINIIYLFISLSSIQNSTKWDIMEIYEKQTDSFQIISICLIKLSIYLNNLVFIKKIFKNKYEKTILLITKKKKVSFIFNIKKKQLNFKNKISFLKQTIKLNNALKLLKIINFSDILTIKGLACSDLNFEDDLLLIELIFSGELNNYQLKDLLV